MTPHRQPGFTLLELLVAIAIFAMLGIGSYRLLATTIATRDAARTHDTDLIRLQKIFTVLNRDIAQAIARPVRNDYGDIRARFAGDGVITVSAVIQRLGPGPEIGVNVERHGDRLAVTVVAPPGRQAVDAERPGKTAIDRADLVIYVPEGVALEAATLRGVVDARRLKSPIEATSGDGELRLETTQWVRAASEIGRASCRERV